MITDLILEFGIASMLNHTTNSNSVTKFMVWFNMEAFPKFDIKSVFKSESKFEIRMKWTRYMDRA